MGRQYRYRTKTVEIQGMTKGAKMFGRLVAISAVFLAFAFCSNTSTVQP
jgi:hypothetical protein